MIERQIIVPANSSKEIVEILEQPAKTVIILEENSAVSYRELAEKPVESVVEVVHKGRNSKSDVVVACIARSGRYSSKTKITMLENAEGSDGKLSQKALVLGNAVVEQRPELDIRNKNVRAGHAASVEQPSEETMFYMKSRGISNPENLIIESFRSMILGA